MQEILFDSDFVYIVRDDVPTPISDYLAKSTRIRAKIVDYDFSGCMPVDQ